MKSWKMETNINTMWWSNMVLGDSFSWLHSPPPCIHFRKILRSFGFLTHFRLRRNACSIVRRFLHFWTQRGKWVLCGNLWHWNLPLNWDSVKRGLRVCMPRLPFHGQDTRLHGCLHEANIRREAAPSNVLSSAPKHVFTSWSKQACSFGGSRRCHLRGSLYVQELEWKTISIAFLVTIWHKRVFQTLCVDVNQQWLYMLTSLFKSLRVLTLVNNSCLCCLPSLSRSVKIGSALLRMSRLIPIFMRKTNDSVLSCIGD